MCEETVSIEAHATLAIAGHMFKSKGARAQGRAACCSRGGAHILS